MRLVREATRPMMCYHLQMLLIDSVLLDSRQGNLW